MIPRCGPPHERRRSSRTPRPLRLQRPRLAGPGHRCHTSTTSCAGSQRSWMPRASGRPSPTEDVETYAYDSQYPPHRRGPRVRHDVVSRGAGGRLAMRSHREGTVTAYTQARWAAWWASSNAGRRHDRLTALVTPDQARAPGLFGQSWHLCGTYGVSPSTSPRLFCAGTKSISCLITTS